MLLPTVRSRCQRLRFGPLAPADVAAVLVDGARIHGGGSPRRGVAAPTAASAARWRARPRTFAEARDAAARVLQSAAGATRSAAAPRRRESAAQRQRATDRDELAPRCWRCRRCFATWARSAREADERSLANADLKPQLHALLRSYDGERALRAFAAVDRALDALDRNAQPEDRRRLARVSTVAALALAPERFG